MLATLLGDLALVPWQRPYQVPTATVFCTWRDAVGPGPLEQLRDLVLAGVDAEHREHDFRAVLVGDLDVCSIDGSLTRVPDTPANREAFGSAGTADDSSPYPQQRDLWLSHASTRDPGRDLRPGGRRRRRREGQGRSRAGTAGQGAEGSPAAVHPSRIPAQTAVAQISICQPIAA